MLKIIKQRFAIFYEIIMALLALTAVSISILDFTGHISIDSSMLYYWIDLGILIIFAIDYLIRFIYSKDKKQFFWKNIFDLLAIIPYNSIFRAFRFTRLFRLARLFRLLRLISIFILLKRFISRADSFIKTNGFVYVLYLTIITVSLGSYGIYYFEFGKTVDSFGDAIWWSFVTATTVGYGDISPVTTPGRIIAGTLMLTGIGFIGMLTGTIATFFINIKKKSQCPIIEQSNIDLSDLSKDEFTEVIRFIEFIKSKR